MSDNVSRQAVLDIFDDFEVGIENGMNEYEFKRKELLDLPSTDREGNWMSFEQVADMLSGMFGECACDVNDNDEWLPLACKYADTECPHPKEENGCWMQFLLQGVWKER